MVFGELTIICQGRKDHWTPNSLQLGGEAIDITCLLQLDQFVYIQTKNSKSLIWDDLNH